jgi:hypothetical protein
MPYGDRMLEISFDFFDHRLRIETGDGHSRSVSLEPKPVAAFYREVVEALASLGMPVRIWPMPVEVPSPIRFDLDTAHHAYDPAWVERWWQALARIDAVFKDFRGRFLGKSSPVHFFWGSFDLAVTRFSGRRAPPRPGADLITREAYSHEVISAGFWPGGPGSDAAFYAYAAPEPAGFRTARVEPGAAFYSGDLGEFLLNYDDVCASASPRETLLAFLQSSYEAGATLGGWDRGALDRT